MSDNPAGPFRTHANYLRAFAVLAGADGAPTRLRAFGRLAATIEAGGCLPPSRTKQCDLAQVRRSLENAWGTEFLLSLGELVQEDEVIRLANNWAVVQTYYVVYHATQALAVAKGFLRPDSHPKTQNQFFDLWGKRPIVLPPWTLAADARRFRNVPTEAHVDDSIHAWTACSESSCWSLACKALRTTRTEAVSDAFVRAREEKRKHRQRAWHEQEDARIRDGKKARKGPPNALPLLSPAEKARAAERVRPHTILDYLYRLRIKTNYEDAAVFTEGPDDEFSSEQVRADLCYLAGSTLLLSEMAILRLVEPSTCRAWMESWVDRNVPEGLQLGLALRLRILKARAA